MNIDKIAIPHFAAEPLALCKNAPASARNPPPPREGKYSVCEAHCNELVDLSS